MESNLLKILLFNFKTYENKFFLTVTKFIFFIAALCILHLAFKDQKPNELSLFVFLEILLLFALVSSKNTSFKDDIKSGFIDEIKLANSVTAYIVSEFIVSAIWNITLMILAALCFYLLFEGLDIFYSLVILTLTIPAIQSLIIISESFGLEIENNLIPIIFTMVFFFPIAIIACLGIANHIFIAALFGINLILIPCSVYLVKKIIELVY